MENFNQENQELTIDIGLILLKLCNFKTIRNIVICGIVCGICAFAYSKFCIPEQYTSQVYMYVNNNAVVTTGGKVEISDINASQKIVESCVVILKDNIVMEEISERLIDDYDVSEIDEVFTVNTYDDGTLYIPVSEISSSINLSEVDETEVMKVSVTTKSPEISQAICQYIVDIAPDMIKRVIDGGRIEAIGEPSFPESKSSPNNTKNCLLGGGMGVFALLAFYVLRILFDNKIKNTEEFSQRYSIPVFAEIPLYKNSAVKVRRKKRKKKDDDLPEANSFAVIEAYNTLCSNILFSCRANDCKVIIVSSAEQNSGKSTIACAVAESLNNIAGNVLLADCDMRNPSVHKILDLKNRTGLSGILSGMTDFEDAVLKDERGLNVITAGPMPSNATEILASKYMDEFIEKCVEKFNYVVIDTPPFIISDAAILSKYSAGVTFVTNAGVTRYKDVEKASEILKLADSKITGIIINGVTAENGYYGKYKYSYNYSSAYKRAGNTEIKSGAVGD